MRFDSGLRDSRFTAPRRPHQHLWMGAPAPLPL